MAIGRTNTGGGGGGGGLNFRVIGATVRPTSAKENDIWVNTSTKIESWIFSSTEPESPTSGMVWFVTASDSAAAFNALKKNEIWVYPVSAAQYIDGAWVDKEAFKFDGAEWIQLIGEVYIIQDGVIDLNAYSYSWDRIGYPSNQSGTASDTVIKQNQTYDGKPALWLAGYNGNWYHHKFANVEIPSFATKFHLQYYRLCAYSNNPIIKLGDDVQVTIDRAGANFVTNGTASIDVTAIRGQTVTLTICNYGSSGNSDNYIGNAWFE